MRGGLAGRPGKGRPAGTMSEAARLGELRSLLSPCRLCPRECGADRLGGETGFCGIGLRPKVAAVSLHGGEEPPLSGRRGAGNIFFSGCNLACLFCQNYPISQMGVGREMESSELALAMLGLQRKGAHNINLVTASHVAPQAAEAVGLARRLGLGLPVVWNSNGYESVETVRLLAGTVDVWLPDMKYADDGRAVRCSGATAYVDVNRRAVEEMFRQAGRLEVDASGLAVRGVIVRHLVLPGGWSGTREVLEHLAVGHPVLGRRLSREEWLEALSWLERCRLAGGWIQDPPEDISPGPAVPAPPGRRSSGDCPSKPRGSGARPPDAGRV